MLVLSLPTFPLVLLVPLVKAAQVPARPWGEGRLLEEALASWDEKWPKQQRISLQHWVIDEIEIVALSEKASSRPQSQKLQQCVRYSRSAFKACRMITMGFPAASPRTTRHYICNIGSMAEERHLPNPYRNLFGAYGTQRRNVVSPEWGGGKPRKTFPQTPN